MMGIFIANSIAVGFFGMILSAAFCDIFWTPKRRSIMFAYMIFLMILQGIVYQMAGGELVRALYPLLMHVPLVLVLAILCKKRLWSVIAVLTSYLCCQLRRWIALFIVAVVNGGTMMQDMVEIILTIPLLWILLKFVAPSVRHISHSTRMEQWRFAIIPILCYGFDYVTRVYTSWLSTGTPVVVEFMFFVCSGVYLISVIRSSKEEEKRYQMEQTQGYLNLQITQSVREIESLRSSQEKANRYRHDLRHHMLYISSCIENGRSDSAKEYIQEVCSEIEGSKVEVFCENETLNLILSAYIGKAEALGISTEVHVAIPSKIVILESDACVLFSNALENAFQACKELKEKGQDSRIEIVGFEKNKKLFFEVINSCQNTAQIKDGVPMSKEPGHGIGIRSICAIVEKYGGVYTFIVKDGNFILRVSL